MNKLALLAATSLLAASPAFAQSATDAAPAPTPAAPAEKVAPAPSAGSSAAVTAPAGDITLADADAKKWIDKVVYSSDGKNVGEIAAFARDASGKVLEMHADIGGFLGLGETRIKVLPSQFRFAGDRAILSLTADEVKALPHLPK